MIDEARTLKCDARTHGFATTKYAWIRCNDKACPDVQKAKAIDMQAVHIFDLETGTFLGTDFREKNGHKQGQN